jgi:hypothetical protein
MAGIDESEIPKLFSVKLTVHRGRYKRCSFEIGNCSLSSNHAVSKK